MLGGQRGSFRMRSGMIGFRKRDEDHEDGHKARPRREAQGVDEVQPRLLL